MGGFVGGWIKRGVIVKEQVLEATRVLRHRGPDEEGFAFKPPVFLGFRRLQTMDFKHGSQPFVNEEGAVHLVFDGTIYNYNSLRRELEAKGHKFRSQSDGEVVLHLYEEEGRACASRLRGMFAFGVYDEKNKLLYGARDRFGIKPFYYLHNSHLLAMASEAKALLKLLKENPSINRQVIPHYLSFQYVPEPETMFEGVFKLPPGHYFIFRGSEMEVKRYEEVTFNPTPHPFSELLELTREVMREAVSLHTRGEVPWGAFLSGGIDSAVIVALLQEQYGGVSTFSVGYEEDEYSELAEARETAEYLETDHQELLIDPREYWECLPRLIWHFDDPVADPAAISLYFVARMASQKITVALSGEGADEVFGGYSIYREPGALRPLQWMPPTLLKLLKKGAHQLPSGMKGKNYLLRAATPLRERFIGNASIFEKREKVCLLKQRNFPSPQVITYPFYQKVEDLDPVTQMQFIDLHTWMPGDILAKADKMTMANSLELRVPFLDQRVCELAFTIPTEYKIRGKTTKYLLRQAFSHMLPPTTTARPKKGFPVPTRVWLKSPVFRQVRELLLNPSMESFFHRWFIDKMLQEHQQGLVDHSRKLWVLIVFAFWLNGHVFSCHASKH